LIIAEVPRCPASVAGGLSTAKPGATRGRARAPRAPGAAAVGGDEDDAAVATTAGGIAAVAVRGADLHGVFDHPALRSAYPNGLRPGPGAPARKSVAPPLDDDIDRLADHVEAHLDAPLPGRILRLQPLQPSARSTFHVTR